MFLPPTIQVKAVVCNTLRAYWHGNQAWFDLAVKSIPIHAQIGMRILGSDHTGLKFHPARIHDFFCDRNAQHLPSLTANISHAQAMVGTVASCILRNPDAFGRESVSIMSD